MYDHLKPQYRSRYRIALGKFYFRTKRQFSWYLTDYIYAKNTVPLPLEHTIIQHKTPLYRSLKKLDMSLQRNKVENLKIALKEINGITIKPGETFSYWKLIGKPTKMKGYKNGMVLHYGSLNEGVGGGLCQLSNMIYWMALHTPLTITERHRHSYDVFPDSNRTQPFGSGATCVYNYKDLQITNNTNEVYQFFFTISSTHLEGAIHSDKMKYLDYEIYEKNHQITQASWGGYIRENELYQKIYNLEGFVMEDKSVAVNKGVMMYEPLIQHQETTTNELEVK